MNLIKFFGWYTSQEVQNLIDMNSADKALALSEIKTQNKVKRDEEFAAINQALFQLAEQMEIPLNSEDDRLKDSLLLIENLINAHKTHKIASQAKIQEERLSQPISVLNLTPRVLKALDQEGYKTLGEVVLLNKDELLKIKSFGNKSLEELLSSLALLGLEIEMK